MKIKIIGVLLVLEGLGGILIGTKAFGDIGVACMIGGLAGLLSGIGFLLLPKN